jgi:hypothetical protein
MNMNWKFPDYKQDLKKIRDWRTDQPKPVILDTPSREQGAEEIEDETEEEGYGAEVQDPTGTSTEMRDVAQQLASRPNIAGAWAEEVDHITKLIVGARLLEGGARKEALEEALAYLRQRNLKPSAKRKDE